MVFCHHSDLASRYGFGFTRAGYSLSNLGSHYPLPKMVELALRVRLVGIWNVAVNLSTVLYFGRHPSRWHSRIASGIYVVAAFLWLSPDPRIERSGRNSKTCRVWWGRGAYRSSNRSAPIRQTPVCGDDVRETVSPIYGGPRHLMDYILTRI